jgi:hypothetical protein
VDYKDDPEWKQWRKAASQKVFLKHDDDHDDGTKATTTSKEGRDTVHKTMKECRSAASASASSSQKSGRTGSSSYCKTYTTPASSESCNIMAPRQLPQAKRGES